MLIGVTGHAQHGKDTVAAYLVANHGFTRLAFADPLKELALRTDPYVPGIGGLCNLVKQMGWEEAKKWPVVRRFLQDLGTEARNIIGEDVWVNALERVWTHSGANNVVISDVRFPNEAAFIHRHSGELWRVMRVGFDNGLGYSHPSEKYISTLPADKVLINDTDIPALYQEAEEALASEVKWP
jgi:hypothetical protein